MNVTKNRIYVGLEQDASGGMTPTGNIIRDAWVFGLLPEEETCAGWDLDRIQQLYDQVSEAWAPYGHLASKLPPPLREKHQAIYDAAIRRARELGWSPDMEDEH
jgi:hypothetical protein